MKFNATLMVSICIQWVVFCQAALSQPARSEGLQPGGLITRVPSTSELLTAAKAAIADNSAQLRSATAQGRIRHLSFRRNVETPVVQLDADLLLIYAAPGFRLHLQYIPREERTQNLDLQTLEADSSRQLNLEQQTILFDGKTVITVERTRQGVWRGDIYFDFHKQNMLRMAGFPFEDPVALWNEPLQIERADLLASQTTPLAGGGFLGILTKENYRLKYYFLGDFGFDLRRVSSYRLGEDVPFRDWHLTWHRSRGVYFVERLVRRNNESAGQEIGLPASALSHEQVELEYSAFDVNADVDPDAFQLASLQLPPGTPFYDHRVNVNGKPKVQQWSDGKLIADAQ